MIGIVIVSHSKKLAEGVLELAEQMTRGAVPLEAVGGIDDPENPIGTDPMRVMAAIEAVAGRAEDGVLVVMDLGSALLSAETALDLLPEAVTAKVRLCAAPLVEGTVAAAVQASVGASLEAACVEAAAALTVKIHQLAPATGDSTPGAAPPAPPPATLPASGTSGATPATQAVGTAETAGATEAVGTDDTLTLTLVIANPLGLHARPAASLVATAGKFQSAITVRKGGRTASAKSINQVALLSVKHGDAIDVVITGPDARQAAAAITALHQDRFGERDEDVSAIPDQAVAETAAAPGVLTGSPASAGYAVGPAYAHWTAMPTVVPRKIADPAAEIRRLDQALIAARAAVQTLAEETQRALGKAQAAIFAVHGLILGDAALREAAVAHIREDAIDAAAAWAAVIQDTAAAYRRLDDAYMQARAADVLDCGARVLRLLTGQEEQPIRLDAPSIIVAHDLSPAAVAGLDPGLVLAVATETGGPTSHAAILARGQGIPAVVGVGAGLHQAVHGQVMALDGFSGKVWPAPDTAVRQGVAAQRQAWLAGRKRARAKGIQPAAMADGTPVAVMANIALPADAARALAEGAEGVGLFRSEFLFQDRDEAPDEDEQYAAYLAAGRAMGGRPVTIRTLDVGGDKPIAYLDLPKEANPFLGLRGVRFTLARPQLFRVQLRALLRAAGEANIRIMYPMVSDPAELEAVRAFEARVREELAGEGRRVADKVAAGIMIEVPAAVAVADKLAARCDFFSIGTNDLTQYVMAADRGNAAVAALCDSLHPAVLRLIARACHAAKTAGIEVALCGELAGDSRAAPLLLGLGLRELSMSAPSIAAVKEAVRVVDLKDCRALANQALDAVSAASVRALLREAADRLSPGS